jgi:hypothetical protein
MCWVIETEVKYNSPETCKVLYVQSIASIKVVTSIIIGYRAGVGPGHKYHHCDV